MSFFEKEHSPLDEGKLLTCEVALNGHRNIAGIIVSPAINFETTAKENTVYPVTPYGPNNGEKHNADKQSQVFGVSNTLFAVIGGLTGMLLVLICLLVCFSKKSKEKSGHEGTSWLYSLQRIRCPKTMSKMRPDKGFNEDPFYEEVVAANAYVPTERQSKGGVRHSYAFYSSFEEINVLGVENSKGNGCAAPSGMMMTSNPTYGEVGSATYGNQSVAEKHISHISGRKGSVLSNRGRSEVMDEMDIPIPPLPVPV